MFFKHRSATKKNYDMKTRKENIRKITVGIQVIWQPARKSSRRTEKQWGTTLSRQLYNKTIKMKGHNFSCQKIHIKVISEHECQNSRVKEPREEKRKRAFGVLGYKPCSFPLLHCPLRILLFPSCTLHEHSTHLPAPFSSPLKGSVTGVSWEAPGPPKAGGL